MSSAVRGLFSRWRGSAYTQHQPDVRFKQPRRIVFRATLPKSVLGKVQNQALIEILKAGEK